MKYTIMGFLLVLLALKAIAQSDSVYRKKTIQIGNMTILHDEKNSSDTTGSPAGKQDTLKIRNQKGQYQVAITIKELSDGLKAINDLDLDLFKKRSAPKKVSTNWLVFDIGFAGYTDKTNYSSSEAQSFMVNTPGASPAAKGDYALKGSRISNFNLWFFMQRASIIKNVVNLKYGFGIESNNYFFKTNITYVDGTRPFTTRGTAEYSKNKLVANYLTVPLMININTNPSLKKKGFQFSAGISGGYLHSSRQKQRSASGMEKNKTDFNLERLKLSYIAELGLGPVKIYGSVAAQPLHQYGLEQYPYTVGLRFSN